MVSRRATPMMAALAARGTSPPPKPTPGAGRARDFTSKPQEHGQGGCLRRYGRGEAGVAVCVGIRRGPWVEREGGDGKGRTVRGTVGIFAVGSTFLRYLSRAWYREEKNPSNTPMTSVFWTRCMFLVADLREEAPIECLCDRGRGRTGGGHR